MSRAPGSRESRAASVRLRGSLGGRRGSNFTISQCSLSVSIDHPVQPGSNHVALSSAGSTHTVRFAGIKGVKGAASNTSDERLIWNLVPCIRPQTCIAARVLFEHLRDPNSGGGAVCLIGKVTQFGLTKRHACDVPCKLLALCKKRVDHISLWAARRPILQNQKRNHVGLAAREPAEIIGGHRGRYRCCARRRS